MKNKIWYEKYRAKELSQLVLPKNTTRNMEGYIKASEIPHLLLHGPVGSGKTTLAMILIKACASSSLILNSSSSDRGIDTVKKKVKQFASSMRMNSKKLNIVLFDEADGMTPDAQRALKNTIETYKSNCRFIFTANEIDKIDDAIYSRCTVFGFDSMPHNLFLKWIYSILKYEGIKYKSKDVEKLIERFGTDVRTILNNLQAGSVSGRFKLKNILTIFDTTDLIEYISNGEIAKIRETWAGQTDFTWLYKFMFDSYLQKEDLDIQMDIRADIGITIAEYLYKDKTVADREINATACLLEIMSLLETEVKF